MKLDLPETSPMRDYFSEMGFPHKAAITIADIRERFHELSRISHPDSGTEPDATAFERLNMAQSELTSCSRRIWHLLELQYGAENLEKKGGVNERLADLFSNVGQKIADANLVLEKRKSASTDLGRALLEEESMGARKALTAVNAEVDQVISYCEEQLGELDDMIENARGEAIGAGLEIWRTMTFLEKWRGQIQEKFAQLF